MHSSAKTRKSLRSRLRRRAKFLALLLGAVPMSGAWDNEAQAQSTYWRGSSANWNAASAWAPDATSTASGGGVPSLTTTAVFNVTAATGAQNISFAANVSALGLNFVSPGNIQFRGNSTGTTARTLTLGTGGMTVASGAGAITVVTTSGQTNTVLTGPQTWAINSANQVTWNSRLIGHESATLTKTGTGSLLLNNTNQNQTAVINGDTVTGMRGRILLNEGILLTGNANALGVADALTTEMTSAAVLPNLISDTVVASGATLNVFNSALSTEFITFSGTGVGGQGAIVNNQTNTGITGNAIQQSAMVGNATVGGSSRFDFRSTASATNEPNGRLFQDGFTLTKTGTNIIGLVNVDVIGGGNIDVQQGALAPEATTNIGGTGTITMQTGTNLNFNSNTGSITRPIILQGTNTVNHTANDGVATINSPITVNGPVTFNVTDNNNATQVGTLNLLGSITSSQDLIKVGSGRLGLNLNGTDFTAPNINVLGGTVELNTTSAIASTINLSDANTGSATIFRPGIAGEGQTTGTVNFSVGGGNLLEFDALTTGPNQYLRIGGYNTNGNAVQVRLKQPAPAGTGIVVLESTAGVTAGDFTFNGRGTLNYTANQVLMDYAPANLVWRGDQASPTFWDIQTTANWLNTGTASSDNFFDGDFLTFDDTVGAGSTTIDPQVTVLPGGMTFNNSTAVTYTLAPTTNQGVVSASLATLTKNNTGTVNLDNIVGGVGSVYGATTINGGALNMRWINPGNTTTTAAVTHQLGFGGSGTVINNTASLISNINVNNSGFGTNPVTVNAGATLAMARGAVPNGTNTVSAATALTNRFSGGGDIVLTGNAGDTSPSQPGWNNQIGQFTINGSNGGFSGRWVLNNARLNFDNGSGDEAGSATIVAPSGSQVVLSGATAVYEGNTFQIAGTGHSTEPGGNVFGALRLATTGVRVGTTSTIELTADNTMIGAQNVTGRIDGTITDGANTFNLQLGAPGVPVTGTLPNQNSTLILAGANTYGGNTNIDNMAVLAQNNQAFGNGGGTLNLNGYTSARVTQLSIGAGTTIANPINISTYAGQGGARGAVEGGTIAQVTELGAGVSTVSGPVTINGSQVATWAHFSAGTGTGSILNVTGAITAPAGVAVQARSNNSGGYVQISNAANSFTAFDISNGTVRLGTNNALVSGSELVTRRVADSNGPASLDMFGFDQTVSHVSRASTLTTAHFRLVNSSTSTSTLTINGTADSNIENIPLSTGAVNIVKNGNGALVLSGTDLGNTGSYTINGGNLEISTGNVAASVNIVNPGTTISGGGTISGAVTLPAAGGISLSAGASPGTLTFNSPIALSGTGNNIEWEIITATGGVAPPTVPGVLGTPGTDYDQYVFNGGLDLTGLNTGGMSVNVFGLSALPNTQGAVAGFDPTLNYTWMLMQNSAVNGFDPNDFVINTTAFGNNNPFTGVFSVAQDGNNVVLRYTANAIPEPSSLLLVTALGVGLLRHRSRREVKA